MQLNQLEEDGAALRRLEERTGVSTYLQEATELFQQAIVHHLRLDQYLANTQATHYYALGLYKTVSANDPTPAPMHIELDAAHQFVFEFCSDKPQVNARGGCFLRGVLPIAVHHT